MRRLDNDRHRVSSRKESKRAATDHNDPRRGPHVNRDPSRVRAMRRTDECCSMVLRAGVREVLQEEPQAGDKMTRFEFIYICEGRTIDPALALENEAVREAIKKGPAAVADALDEEF